MILAQPGNAQSTEHELRFDIPAQSLDAALEAYMQLTSSQILYRSALANGHVSAELRGRFTPSQALSKLLSGTGLMARYTTEGAFTVRPTSVAQPDAARQMTSYETYLGDAQNRVVAALCRDTGTRPGGYRVALQFSIGRSGLIDDPSLLDSTGDGARDHDIVSALRGLAIGKAPPTSMPQPVTMLIAPRAPGLPDECRRFSR